ncbi:acyl-CoA carboxylase subunit epsilon [Cellulomonas sp. HZM]|uniref:acyl-CoA carboxylase subunit epsilon n=1 Tax=Cellulomonas sp. HZM TaxID=1454010 RepID=UPI00049363E8|nr:acyl-CoA carboxylase subunit epsilon [Cellulomonas sp. HZM]
MSDPHVRVVRGTPDEHELAALVAGIMAAMSSDDHAPEHSGARSVWTDRRGGVRPAGWRTGPDTWRWSLRG